MRKGKILFNYWLQSYSYKNALRGHCLQFTAIDISHLIRIFQRIPVDGNLPTKYVDLFFLRNKVITLDFFSKMTIILNVNVLLAVSL